MHEHVFFGTRDSWKRSFSDFVASMSFTHLEEENLNHTNLMLLSIELHKFSQ